MKMKFFFLACCIWAVGCQNPEEEVMDLDKMALSEDEIAEKQLAGDPVSSPQEVLIQEHELFEPLE